MFTSSPSPRKTHLLPEVLEKPESLEHLTGRALKPGKPGRPVKSKLENGIMSPE
jgi:hypothetical protein